MFAAAHSCEGKCGGIETVVTGIDIRYLDPVRVGPIQARAEILSDDGRDASVNVRIVDVGNEETLVAYVCATARRL